MKSIAALLSVAVFGIGTAWAETPIAPKGKVINSSQGGAKSPQKWSANFDKAFELGVNHINSIWFYGCKSKTFIFKHSTNLTSVQTTYFQVLEPVPTVYEGPPVSEIDRLNGLEWQGRATLTFKAIRHLKNKQSWSEWAERSKGFTTLIEKRNGKWEFLGSWDGYFENPESCSDVAALREFVTNPEPQKSSQALQADHPVNTSQDSENIQGSSFDCSKASSFIEQALCKAIQGGK